MEYVDVEV